MTADANLITATNVAARVADVEFVRAFDEDVRVLTQALEFFTPIKKAPGTTLKYYETSGTLESGQVGEGEDIPLSKYSTTGVHLEELTWGKWAKATTLEAITKDGYDAAVTRTDNKFRKDIQSVIRKDLFDFLKTGTGKDVDGTAAVTGTTLQQTLANVWGTLQVNFENTDSTPVYFLNPMDVADYLGTANLATSGTTVFGMQYIQNFLGIYNVMLASDIPAKSVIATPEENLKTYYSDASEAAGFDYVTMDETGYIGVYHEANYGNATFKTNAVSALKFFADYLDKIYVATIAPSA